MYATDLPKEREIRSFWATDLAASVTRPGLMGLQWLLGIAFALWVSVGAERNTLVWAAILLGGFLVVACLRSVAEMRQTAARTAALEHEVRRRQEAEDESRHAAATMAELVEELKVTQRQAEIATRAKSEFLASMSHELRTPLNAIILYSELLQEEAKSRDAVGSIPDLQHIQSSGKHLLDLINGMLDFSRIEAGKMGVELRRFAVKPMIDELAGSVSSLVHKHRNVLTVRCHANIGMMRGDLTKTRQILLNLLSNAAKFTTEGSITVEVRRLNQGGGEQIEFSVSDTGVGMTEHQSRIVLEPFTRTDVTTTRQYRGTGLGLAIVSRFCELMGGTITVQSKLGHGSRFVVRLPADVVDQSAQHLTAGAA